jgi:hypothetical protein
MTDKIVYVMMFLGASMAFTCIGALLLFAYEVLTLSWPTLDMALYYAFTLGISLITWRLDAHYNPKYITMAQERKKKLENANF